MLKGLSFSVGEGEKVTIVGRTGSGKSTVFLALTRLIEIWDPETNFDPEDKNFKEGEKKMPTAGEINFDGVDTANLPLHDLR